MAATPPPVSARTLLDGDGRAGRGSRDQVVAAGVAEAAEGVVLGEEGDARPLFAGGGAKGGREVAEGLFDGEAVVAEVVAEPGGGVLFLEAGLRVVVDAVAEVDEGVSLRLDLVDDAGLQLVRRRLATHHPLRAGIVECGSRASAIVGVRCCTSRVKLVHQVGTPAVVRLSRSGPHVDSYDEVSKVFGSWGSRLRRRARLRGWPSPPPTV